MIAPGALHRREYKYFISEHTADRIRRFIRGICAVDSHAVATGGRYLIDTLYLDTAQLHSYRATVENSDDRWKLRIRGYPSAGADGPVFLEVKRRVCDSIIKTRGAFTGDWVRLLERTDPAILAAVAPGQRGAIDNFLCRYHVLPMQPSALVRYEREPYVSEIDDYARVTFDRDLEFRRPSGLTLEPERAPWARDDGAVARRLLSHHATVLLELKFTNLVPVWMRHMVRALDIQRLAFCKYTRGIDELRGPVHGVVRAGRVRW